MKKKIHTVIFGLLTSFILASNVSAAFSQVELGFLDSASGKSVPIHSGSVLGTVNHVEHHYTGKGYVMLSVRKHLVGGIHPEVFRVRSEGGLQTGRTKLDPSNYYPRGQSSLARGYVSISG
ncbi:hypothetical protein [Ornithinibacillus scapharcae]|uniref:hypothetical protein n=1 Tax=Ornithinibacillus scapharcae TaxID=1147159 RepID=UPI000225BD67|nr:hypothetical protein [Ornithinibacillus scapharcae]